MTPVLEIAGALPKEDESPLRAPVDLRLCPGELALVDAPDPRMARALTELCTGLPALAAGWVRVLGQDFAQLPRRAAEALRGRIGLAPGVGGWLPHLSVETGMMIARRHHGVADEAALYRDAERLCRHFGLDGVPNATPHELTQLELSRAGCARAFLGSPALLLLESPLDIEAADKLVAPIRAALEPVLAAGAAAVWCTHSPHAWKDPSFPAACRLRLDSEGLVPA
jgi:predicted ABC-type transport system involved in lysophospholipase L1 biosynthesis ATPase subunit